MPQRNSHVWTDLILSKTFQISMCKEALSKARALWQSIQRWAGHDAGLLAMFKEKLKARRSLFFTKVFRLTFSCQVFVSDGERAEPNCARWAKDEHV